jgi:Xaa-Pro aminopeptidase
MLATDFRYVEQANKQASSWQLRQIGAGFSWFAELVSELKLHRIGVEAEHLTLQVHHRLLEALRTTSTDGNVSLAPTEGLVARLRIVKDPDELALMQRAANIADLGMEAAASAIAEGQTERVVAWAIEKAMREAGAEGVSFDVIVAAGANGAMPHHSPSDHAIQSGEPIVIDIGARYRGYCSDLTRTLFVGQPDDLFRKVYDIVLGAQLTAMSLIRPDMTGEAADSLARKVIDEAGYGSAFGHALGHGVGLAVHEDPRLGPGSTLALGTGMVFSVEPGIYIPAKGGVRIEDMVVLEEGGVRSLSQATKTL